MNIKLKGVQKVLNDLAKLDEKVTKDVDGEIEAASNSIRDQAVKNAPANFSNLKASIGQAKVGPLRYTVFANIWHAPYVEFGTVKKVSVPVELQEVAQQVKNRPKRGNFKSFIEDIYLWGTYKGVIKKGDRQHARNIARKIYMNGIAPQPYLWPAFVNVRPKLIARLKAEIERIKL